MKSLSIDQVSFNVDLILKRISEGMTEKQFVDQKLAEGKYKQYSKADRIKLLKDAYKRIKQM